MTGVSMTRRNSRLSAYCVLVSGVFWLGVSAAVGADRLSLVNPTGMLGSARHVAFTGEHRFGTEVGPHGAAVRLTPQRSAAGLYQPMQIDGHTLRNVRWTWRVDALQSSADLRDLGREDVGAAVFFVFGEPSVFNRDVPTLAYVWSSTPVDAGMFLPSLRFSSLYYIQMRGRGDVGAWRSEARDIEQDYRLIFGEEPPELHYVAFFNDNDQTGEATSASFGAVEALLR